MMKLWVSETSPYARKTMIAVRELGLQDRVEEVHIKTSPLASNPDLVAANPLGKIPSLIANDGFAVFDSRVICRYLDELTGAPELHPIGNIKHETSIALADGILDAAVSAAYEKRMRPAEKQFDDWITAQLGKIEQALRVAERDFMDVFQSFNMGAITLLCAVEYLDLRHDQLNWRQIAPEIAKWHEEFSERPSAKDTRTPK